MNTIAKRIDPALARIAEGFEGGGIRATQETGNGK